MNPSVLPDRGAIRFQVPRDAGAVLNVTLAFVKATVRPLLVGYAGIVGPVALAAGLAVTLFFRRFGALFSADPATMSEDQILSLFGPTYFGTILFSILTSATILAYAGAFVRRYRAGDPPEAMTVGALWDETRGLLLPSIGMLLAMMLLFALSFVIVIVPCLGILAWFVGVFWLIPYIQTAMSVRLTEGGRLGDAVARARQLVRGRWKTAGGGILLAWVVAYVAMMALMIPFYMAMGLTSVGTLTDPEAMATMMERMAMLAGPMQVVTSAVMLLPMLAGFFVHGSLSADEDGGAIWDDVDRLAGWADDEPPAPRSDAFPPADEAPARPPEAPGDPPASGFRGGGFGPGA